ncbi:branched-chain amino acid ABC transporter substrate-binding protein [Sulfuriferula nivalis]|uniref:Branched chain amino acid ABC transporter substrate-binding protein n=1 Tax=Sulfuriferula nivalis TaxID=2675298 RepID=A0A809S783_9PROT|nr:branched-chain amino acid ABC transporter substrate-binding protein [Sulfuriferula nivalis]BBO99361.1 branched chain amino acid ABC transporter substrate-binding protein [Sulfuriferula nivalis]
MPTTFRLSLLTALIGATLLTGCSKSGTDDNIVKIGSASPLTGPQAHLGKDNENGARLAVDEINAAGLTLDGKKVQIDLIAEDDQADPKAATTVAQKLVDEGIVGVIGHLNSGATIPASKIYFDAGIPQISPSATAIAYTASGFNTAYRVMTNDKQQGSALAEYAISQLGAKRIAIVDDRTAYGQGLADEFERAAKAAGADVVAREYTTDKSTDFMAILTSIKSHDPQVVFFAGMDPQAAPMIKQMKQLGVNAQFLGGDGMQTPKFIDLAGADAEGAIASNPGLPLAKMPGGEAFKQKFNARFGEIQNYSPYAYDAVYVMVEAMKRAKSSDPVKYLAELPKTDYQGVTGHIRFDSKGDLTGGAVTLYQVKAGQWQPLQTINSK